MVRIEKISVFNWSKKKKKRQVIDSYLIEMASIR